MKRIHVMDDTKILKKSCHVKRPFGAASPDFGNQFCSIHDMHRFLNTASATALLLIPGNPVAQARGGKTNRQLSDVVEQLDDIAKAYAILLSKLTTDECTEMTSCIFDAVLTQLRKNQGADNKDVDSNVRKDDQLREQAREITEAIQKKILSSNFYLNDARNIPQAPIDLSKDDDEIACVSLEEATDSPIVVDEDEILYQDDEVNDMIQRGYFTQTQHRGLVPDALLASLALMQPCEIQESDRVGPYRDHVTGMIGFCCPYCNGQPDNGRYFPNRMKQLLDGQYDFKMLRHFAVQCPNCPSTIRNTIVRLAQDDVAKPVKRSKTSRTTVWSYVWKQLESTDARDLAAATLLH
jgi:hypothetical protein